LQLFSLKYIEDYWKPGNWKLDRHETKLIETGSRKDKTVLSCLQLCLHRQCRKDKTVLSGPCWRGEQAIIDTNTLYYVYVQRKWMLHCSSVILSQSCTSRNPLSVGVIEQWHNLLSAPVFFGMGFV